tara:strand:- start:538 stop:717 length:180 start_codon:yes stop_codon:yes gene_type:complete
MDQCSRSRPFAPDFHTEKLTWNWHLSGTKVQFQAGEESSSDARLLNGWDDETPAVFRGD